MGSVQSPKSTAFTCICMFIRVVYRPFHRWWQQFGVGGGGRDSVHVFMKIYTKRITQFATLHWHVIERWGYYSCYACVVVVHFETHRQQQQHTVHCHSSYLLGGGGQGPPYWNIGGAIAPPVPLCFCLCICTPLVPLVHGRGCEGGIMTRWRYSDT